MSTCIWCQRSDQPSSVEHIIPEAIGCPEQFVLCEGEVCQPCNNGLAFLDQAIVQEFDITSFMAGVRGKRGRPVKIDSRGNIEGYRTKAGPVIAINMDPIPTTTPDGVRVAPPGKTSRNVKASLEKKGSLGKVSFELAFGASPLFSRALHKIALGALTYFSNEMITLKTDFDPVREFVVSGKGDRSIIMIAADDSKFRNQAWPPRTDSQGNYLMCFRLAMVEFLVDLSPEQIALPKLLDELKRQKGNKGWTVLPVL